MFSPDGRGLMKTSASGHAPERITEREKGSFAHSWPAFLPGETEVAFTSVFSGSASAIEAVSLKTRATRRLVDQGCCAAFTSSGHFLTRTRHPDRSMPCHSIATAVRSPASR